MLFLVDIAATMRPWGTQYKQVQGKGIMLLLIAPKESYVNPLNSALRDTSRTAQRVSS